MSGALFVPSAGDKLISFNPPNLLPRSPPRQPRHDPPPARMAKLGFHIPWVEDDDHLENKKYYVQVSPRSGLGADPEILVPISAEEFLKDSKKTGAFFKAEVNFHYRLYVLTWTQGDDELEAACIYETSTLDEAMLIYQQQYQMRHQHGPWDQDLEIYPQIPVEGLDPLLEDEFYQQGFDDMSNSFIAILSLDQNYEDYLNFYRE